MCKYEELIKLIYSFYPQNCSFDEGRYQNSTEYSRYIKRISNLNVRNKVSNDIYNEIKLVLPQNYIVNWKNEDYPSKHFSILLHKGQDILDDDEDLLEVLEGERYDLQLYVSLLEKYYYVFIDKTLKISSKKHDLKFYVIDEPDIYKEDIEKVNCTLKSLGYKRINRKIAHKLVPNIETELLYKGNVKIFNCLFTDIVSQF